MKLYGPDRRELMTVSRIESEGSQLVIKAKVFGTMPMTASLTPADVREGLKQYVNPALHPSQVTPEVMHEGFAQWMIRRAQGLAHVGQQQQRVRHAILAKNCFAQQPAHGGPGRERVNHLVG